MERDRSLQTIEWPRPRWRENGGRSGVGQICKMEIAFIVAAEGGRGVPAEWRERH